MIECQNEDEENIDDLSPVINKDETDIVEEIDEVLVNGPKAEKGVKSVIPISNSELLMF